MTPVTLTLPWSVLLHDNHKHMPAVIKGKARLILSAPYRKAKTAAECEIKRQYRGELLLGDVQLVAHCYFPDRRTRDAGNYRKLICDALSALVYADDSQLCDERWIRAGYDRTNPRIELILTEIAA